jgi:hypothetical protein
MATYNKINGQDAYPMGAQKRYLLNLLNTDKCSVQGINFNGYGYSDQVRNYTLSAEEVVEYNNLAPRKQTKKKSYEERMQVAYDSWCKRLSKLTGITIEEARVIADEKLAYKQDRINMMIERSFERPSIMRDRLIAKMERENPLRRIEDEAHAQAIIAASNRHKNTNYEDKLEEARELAKRGDIQPDEVKEYARTNMVEAAI